MSDEGRYIAAVTVPDVWICYPWEATYVQFSLFLSSADKSHEEEVLICQTETSTSMTAFLLLSKNRLLDCTIINDYPN